MDNDDEEVIISGVAIDVPADNYEEFDLEIEPEKLGQQLVQTNILKGTDGQYQFYASRYLLLNFVEKKNARARHYRLDLAWLNPEPEHVKVIVWNWLYGAIFATVLSGLCLYLGIAEIIDVEYCFVAAALTLTASLICLLMFIYLMRDEFVFKSHFGNARLFLIDNKKPAQASFDDFFVALQQCIDKAQTQLSVAERLVGELRMCRRLKDEGIIDDEAYIKVRTLIFKHEQYKK